MSRKILEDHAIYVNDLIEIKSPKFKVPSSTFKVKRQFKVPGSKFKAENPKLTIKYGSHFLSEF